MLAGYLMRPEQTGRRKTHYLHAWKALVVAFFPPSEPYTLGIRIICTMTPPPVFSGRTALRRPCRTHQSLVASGNNPCQVSAGKSSRQFRWSICCWPHTLPVSILGMSAVSCGESGWRVAGICDSDEIMRTPWLGRIFGLETRRARHVGQDPISKTTTFLWKLPSLHNHVMGSSWL